MSLEGWLVSYSIEYSDGGAPQKLTALQAATDKVAKSYDALARAAKKAAAATGDLGGAANTAASGVTKLADALDAQAASAARAQRSNLVVTDGFDAIAASATAAAASVARAQGIIAAGGGGLMGSTRSWRDVGAGLMGQRAITGSGPNWAYGGTPWGGGGGRGGGGAIPLAGGAYYQPPESPRALTGGGGGGDDLPPPPRGGGGGGGRFGGFGRGVAAAGGAVMGWNLPGWLEHHAAKAAKDTAIAAGAATIDALYEAGHYQTTMRAIKNVTGADDAKMKGLDALLYQTAMTTAMSPTQTAHMFLDIARQTPNMQFADKAAMLPYVAKSALVLGSTRGLSSDATSEAAINFVHLFQAYSRKDMPKMFDLFTRSGEVMGINPQQALTQYSYFVPQANTLGVDPMQDIILMSELANTGLGKRRGGTGVANFINAGLGIGVGGAKSIPALEKLGILGPHGEHSFYKRGDDGKFHLNIIGMLDKLNQDSHAMSNNGDQSAYMTLLKRGFGTATLHQLGVLTSDKPTQMRHNTTAALKRGSLGLEMQYTTLMNQFDKVFLQSGKDFQALATEVGTLMLPAATLGFHNLNIAMGEATGWLKVHPEAEKRFTKELITDVTMLSDWCQKHKSDFVQLATEAEKFVVDLQQVGKILAPTANALLAIGHGLDAAYKFTHPGGNTQSNAPMNNMLNNMPLAKLEDWIGSKFHHGREQRTVRHVHVHTHNHNVTGGGPAADHHFREQTKRALHEMFYEPSDPRHASGKSGSIHTSANRPSRDTTPIASGG